jgi:hypothetical protein
LLGERGIVWIFGVGRDIVGVEGRVGEGTSKGISKGTNKGIGEEISKGIDKEEIGKGIKDDPSKKKIWAEWG